MVKTITKERIHHDREKTKFDPLKYMIDIPILVAFICMSQSIKLQRVTVLPAKSDSDVMFCYSYQGLIIDRSRVY